MNAETIDINDMIGKPWVLGARGPEAFDCWGVVREAMMRLHPGRALPDWQSDGLNAEQQRAYMHAGALVHGIELAVPTEGAILLDDRRGHIGLVLRGRVLTSHATSGVVLVRLDVFAAHFPDARAYRWRP